MADITILNEIDSTNTYLKQHAPDFRHGQALMAINQTAGRGQRGNQWEAEPGKNLSISIILRHTELQAQHHFSISEIVALAVAQIVEEITGKATTVKWPNDIYVDDNKISGILIENTLTGSLIDTSIVGIGLNINQVTFRSSAPNPISIAQITHSTHDITDIAHKIVDHITTLYQHHISTPQTRNSLHMLWLTRLWRKEGYHPYIDTATGQHFSARIADVQPSGHLILVEPTDITHRYAFKEVTAVV